MSTKGCRQGKSSGRMGTENFVYERVEPAHEIPGNLFGPSPSNLVEPLEANLMLNGPWQRESIIVFTGLAEAEKTLAYQTGKIALRDLRKNSLHDAPLCKSCADQKMEQKVRLSPKFLPLTY